MSNFKAGDKVRRLNGIHNGMRAGDTDTVIDNVGTCSLKLNQFGTGHDASKFELVPKPVKPAIVQTVTATYVAEGQYVSKGNMAVLRWQESDDEPSIDISVPDQNCNESDLREFAAVLIELADKLAATKR